MKFVIIHQHDPTIPNVGGIGTFIDAFIRNAPEDVEVDLIGVSADPERYAPGRWHQIERGGGRFRFLPLLAANPVHVPRFPLTISMLWALFRHRRMLDLEGAVLEFHRLEYLLGFILKNNPKALFLHGNNMKDFYNQKTEVRWGRFPWLYFRLEKMLLPMADVVHIVREDAVRDYRAAYPKQADAIHFVPTWVDEAVFRCFQGREREDLRRRLRTAAGIPDDARLFLFVGRYEGQKDPLRLLEAFRRVRSRDPGTVLVMIGDGSLKGRMEDYVHRHELSTAVRFLAPMSQHDVADWMNAADALCLSSAFEGMPCVILEALYCGLPVVSTSVGEAPRLIGRDEAGRLVGDAGPEAFASAMIEVVREPPGPETCRSRVRSYTAARILSRVYAAHMRALEAAEPI